MHVIQTKPIATVSRSNNICIALFGYIEKKQQRNTMSSYNHAELWRRHTSHYIIWLN